jgi:spore cortex formation protein SpoVR/YcgB (stage V sporulation)
MMTDIRRICIDPTERIRRGSRNRQRRQFLNDAQEVWANYRDEGFVAQFLSPRLIREWRMFHLMDDAEEPELVVSAIHDDRGYRRIRRMLAQQYDVAWLDPDIEVIDVDLEGDRRLILHHKLLKQAYLREEDARRVLQHIADLWGYKGWSYAGRSDQRTCSKATSKPARVF